MINDSKGRAVIGLFNVDGKIWALWPASIFGWDWVLDADGEPVIFFDGEDEWVQVVENPDADERE